MSIGLMDADLATYSLVPFNLEIMKLSAYYKRKGEVVIFSPSFTPDKNTYFIYRKDYNDGQYPPHLLTTPNVEVGGLAFSNNRYVPLSEEIECMKPDTTIYNKQVKAILAKTSKRNERIFKTLQDAEHCRISLDGQTVWPHYMQQFKLLSKANNIIFHDYDLNAIEGGYEAVQEILSHSRQDGRPTRIGMKFPVKIDKGADLVKWTNLYPNSLFYSLEYNGVIDSKSFMEFITTPHEDSIYQQMDYYVTATSSSENDFVKNYLREIFRQVIISRSYRIFFSLKYEDNFFFDKRWEKVLDLFNFYHTSFSRMPVNKYYNIITNDTMFDFAKHTTHYPPEYYTKALTKQEIRDIFQFVGATYPELFDDFYTCSYKTLGGTV